MCPLGPFSLARSHIKYDGEEDILTLNLLFDIEKGDVDILP